MIKKIVFGITILSSFSSCTKYSNPGPVIESYEIATDTTIITPKVLVIAVDGLPGNQLKDFQPDNISLMIKNGKYSYTTFSDSVTLTPASWTTLLTGYSSKKHHILTDSYLAPSGNDVHNGAPVISPPLVFRLEEREKRLNTAALMRNEELANNILVSTDYLDVLSSDEMIRDVAVERLKEGNTDFMLTQFLDVSNAGKDGGFVVSNHKFKLALERVDGYIGELLKAISSRKSYHRERWLVVVTSPHGGTIGGSYGGKSSEEIETFTNYYYKEFQSKQLEPKLKNVDLVPQILYWFGIKPINSWQLEGTLFLDKFQNEFLK